MPVKSFRGKMQKGDIVQVPIHTIKGKVGYRIHKLEGMPVDTVAGSNEGTLSVWTVAPATAPTDISFDDNRLIGVFYFLRDQGVVAITSESVIFDNVTFNQDIYICYADSQTNTKGFNFHIELEERVLDLAEQTTATLKDIRNIDPA
jgi:hypothetical protein